MLVLSFIKKNQKNSKVKNIPRSCQQIEKIVIILADTITNLLESQSFFNHRDSRNASRKYAVLVNFDWIKIIDKR